MSQKSILTFVCLMVLVIGGWSFAQSTFDSTISNPGAEEGTIDFNPEPNQSGLTVTLGARLIPLEDAVAEFNRKAAKSVHGAKQPPLTEDEVVAAIRNWDSANHKIDKEMHALFELIAAKKMIPETAVLDSLTDFTLHGFRFDVWQIGLEVRNGRKGYRYPIRQQMLKSTPIDESEDFTLEIKK